QLSNKLSTLFFVGFVTTIYLDAEALAKTSEGRTSPKIWYNLLSRKFPTIDLPFGILQHIPRDPQQILDSQYATSEEKVRLLGVLMEIPGVERVAEIAYSDSPHFEEELPRPSVLAGVLLQVVINKQTYFLDPGLEVAPFGMLPAKLRGRK